MKTLFLTLSPVVLIACSSTYVYEPEPINNDYSYAYNIANQTILTKKNSPLRDFTLNEIQNTELDLAEGVGGLSIGLGVLGLLAGDFIGLSALESGIHIAGGTVTKLATSNHPSSDPRWIILLPKDKYKNEVEAQQDVSKMIQNASEKVLSKYGNVELAFNDQSRAEGFRLDGIPVGVTVVESFKQGNKIKLVDIVNFQSNEFKEYYGFGFERLAFHISMPSPLIYNVKKPNNKIDYIELIKEVTAELPKNYFAYLPSYPRAFYEDETGFNKYQDYSIHVPMIITEGKAHKFIKPSENKESL